MVEEFIEFCRTKGGEAYDYLDNYGCAVAQFLIATGRSREPNCSREGYYNDEWGFVELPEEMDDLAVAHPRTFAGIVERYEVIDA